MSSLCFLPGSDETVVISKPEKDVKITSNLQKIKTKAVDTSTPQIHSKISIPRLLFGAANANNCYI